jgi:methylase of polypeptide subunit release factors
MTISLHGAPPEYGEVFTRRWVSEMILDLCGYTPSVNLTELTVMDPSIGSGAFVESIVDRLMKARAANGVAWADLAGCVRGWDLQPHHVDTCRKLAREKLVDAECPPEIADRLAATWFRAGDFLLDAPADLSADVVVGNPPYIRIENLAPDLLSSYRAACPTMGGRADVFIGFYDKALDVLTDGGVLGFICADRWMHNDYGKRLRDKIVTGPFAMETVIAMHDADAFETDVSAYPAVTIISRGPQRDAVVASAGAEFGPHSAQQFLDWFDTGGNHLDTPDVTASRMDDWYNTDASWPSGSPDMIAWLERLEETLPLIEDPGTGTRIGIGVATGADAVYVVREPNLPDVEAVQLLPLAHAADVRTGVFTYSGYRLVSPWTADGLVNLADYPKLAAYYNSHAQRLTGRNVAKRSGPAWFRTIDRVNLGLLDADMLVLGDMRKHITPVRVPAGFYPHHNLYFIVSKEWDLDVLGGLLLADVVEAQVAAYCVKMRGGTLRFQAQYLRRVRIPSPDRIPEEFAQRFAAAFRNQDREAANTAGRELFAELGVPAPQV